MCVKGVGRKIQLGRLAKNSTGKGNPTRIIAKDSFKPGLCEKHFKVLILNIKQRIRESKNGNPEYVSGR